MATLEELWIKADRIEVTHGPNNETHKLIFKVGQQTIGENFAPPRVIAKLKARNFRRTYFADDAKLVNSSYTPYYEENEPSSLKQPSRFLVLVTPTRPPKQTTPITTEPVFTTNRYKKFIPETKEELEAYFNVEVDICRERPIVYKTLQDS